MSGRSYPLSLLLIGLDSARDVLDMFAYRPLAG
jgi:hypothetical protein